MASITDYLANVFPIPPKRRILSDKVKIYVFDINNNQIQVGEFDQFSATLQDKTRVIKPAGRTREIVQYIPGSWELSFSGGKVDYGLARLIHFQDVFSHQHMSEEQAGAGNVNFVLGDVYNVTPTFVVQQDTYFYDGSYESFFYKDVVLYGYGINVEGDLAEVKESVKGYATKRVVNEVNYIDNLIPGYEPNALIAKAIEKELGIQSTAGPLTTKMSGFSNLA